MSSRPSQHPHRWVVFASIIMALALTTLACGTARQTPAQAPGQPGQAGSGGPTQPQGAAKSISSNNPFENIPQVEFTGKGSMDELPFNVMEEFIFGGQGGGGYVDVCADHPKDKLLILEQSRTVPLFDAFAATVCGWQPNEPVTETITYPDGHVKTQDNYGGYAGGCLASFYPQYGDLLGKYSMALDGKSGHIELQFEVVDAVKAVASSAGTGQVVLYGFQPNERVKVIHYLAMESFIAKLDGWQTFTVDERGRLILRFNEDFPVVSVVGEKSTQVSGSSMIGCNPKFPARLKPGMTARVAYTDGMDLLIREKPGKESKVIGRMKEGTQFSIAGGPNCIVNMTVWYQVTNDKGVTGWVLEAGNDDYYYIEPKP